MVRGRFSDGLSAAQHPVTIYPGAAALTIVDADGRTLDTWPYRGLRLAEEVYRDQPARLLHGERPDAILRVDCPDNVRRLCQHIPGLNSRYLARFGPLPRLLMWGSFALLAVTLLIVVTPHLAAASARFVPLEWERSLGDMVVAGIGSDTCSRAQGEAALQTLVNKLTGSRSLPAPLQITVTQSEQINAFAAPGGHVVLLSGLIENAQSPEQLAGVLAHEIGHVAERHPMEGALRAVGLSIVVSAIVGDVSGLAALATSVGEHLAVMSYSRATEAEADALAVEMLNEANIRGDDFVLFFNQLDDSENPVAASFGGYLSSHPPPKHRARGIREHIRGSGDAMTAAEWQAVKGMCQ